jgi:UDP:flavonoid glycosyltransferase YjiC (YdhE family)
MVSVRRVAQRVAFDSRLCCSALWAGIPSVCVPFIFDSRFWADRLFAIGAAARPLPVENLTALSLAAAIKDVASSSSIKKAAESLKQGLVDHNGAGACANLLRRIVQRPWDRTVMEVARRPTLRNRARV